MSSNNKQKSNSELVRQKTLYAKILKYLYHSVDGSVTSFEYRKTVADVTDPSLTFGEIVPESFLQILCLTDLQGKTNLKFVDLGSGIGRACMCAAAAPFDFTSIWGIEIMEPLVVMSLRVQDKLNKILESNVNDPVPHSSPRSETLNQGKLYGSIRVDSDDEALMTVILKHLANNKEASNDSEGTVRVPLDVLANDVCKTLGHKKYKLLLKVHKSFKGFLQKRSDMFTVTDNKYVSVLTGHHQELEQEGSKHQKASVFTNVPLSSSTSNNCVSAAACVGASDGCCEHGSEKRELLGGEEDNEVGKAKQVQTTDNEEEVFALRASDKALFLPMPNIKLECGDIFEKEWYISADFVYVASLLFSDQMMYRLSVLVLQMKPGSWFVSLRPLIMMLPPTTNNYKSSSNSSSDAGSSGVSTTSSGDKQSPPSSSSSISSTPPPKVHPVLTSESYFKMSWRMANVYIYHMRDVNAAAISISDSSGRRDVNTAVDSIRTVQSSDKRLNDKKDVIESSA